MILFEASDFCYTIYTGPLLKVFLDILLLSCVVEISLLWISQPLHVLPQFIDEMDDGVGYLVVPVLDLGGHCVGQPTSFPSLSPPG